MQHVKKELQCSTALVHKLEWFDDWCGCVCVCVSGLSEVIGGMGQEKLHKLMGDIISTAERPDIMPNVRDGYIMTYIYLPSVFGTDFAQYVGPILPSILQVRHKLSLFCCSFFL